MDTSSKRNSPRKKGRPGPPEAAEHAVRLYLPTNAHRELRVEAAKLGLSMSSYAQAVVLERLGFVVEADTVHRGAS